MLVVGDALEPNDVLELAGDAVPEVVGLAAIPEVLDVEGPETVLDDVIGEVTLELVMGIPVVLAVDPMLVEELGLLEVIDEPEVDP